MDDKCSGIALPHRAAENEHASLPMRTIGLHSSPTWTEEESYYYVSPPVERPPDDRVASFLGNENALLLYGANKPQFFKSPTLLSLVVSFLRISGCGQRASVKEGHYFPLVSNFTFV